LESSPPFALRESQKNTFRRACGSQSAFRRLSTVYFAFTLAFLIFVVPAQAADPATVTFALDFPGSDPDHYSIAVRADGHVAYESSAKISSDSDDHENYQMEFTMSEATRNQIFDLAARAHYFSGKIEAGSKKMAFTGTKKLTYTNGQQNSSAEFNYSSQPSVQQLTSLFQSIAATLEFGRRLAYDHRYQKLALDEELKHMESQATSGELAELQAVKPILQALYDDASVMNVVRARAQRIMESGAGPAH
jgi:hypothetical protein